MKTALIVDGDEGIRLVIGFQLKKLGFETILAANGIEAVELTKQQVFQLIVVDLQLELLNGIQTIKAIREIELGAERVQAHIVGTSSDHDVATNMILAGADEFLEKPFELKSIKQIVSRC